MRAALASHVLENFELGADPIYGTGAPALPLQILELRLQHLCCGDTPRVTAAEFCFFRAFYQSSFAELSLGSCSLT